MPKGWQPNKTPIYAHLPRSKTGKLFLSFRYDRLMNFAALTFTSPGVIIHLTFAFSAFVIGGVKLATAMGTRTHTFE
jgi:hypothetical protein